MSEEQGEFDRLNGEVDRLKAELAKAQAENARLAAAIETEPELPGHIPETVAQFYELNPEECLRAVVRATKASIKKRAKYPAVLRDLLGPTIAHLEQDVEWHRQRGWQSQMKRGQAELARLRAVMEGK